ncbi:MAG: acylneuraminate cytidylyltransferase family protein [Lachnospiraceae bacterium]|nr:acylneuraminate cytidylyltransferase family protein [Lachnospiraceae bacterium]
MKNIAFIPARGGSKSIPLKNIHEINGKPLIYWTVKAAHDSKSIDHIYVSTDSEKIRNTVESFEFEDVTVVDRSPESASDSASTEDAMLEFAENYTDFENICLIQATSPLLTSEDIDGGFALFETEETDSVFSGNRKYQFIWTDENPSAGSAISAASEKSFVIPTYDIKKRPRRQDWSGYIVENGAFYITSRALLLKSSCRFSGRIKAYEMPANRIFEIDEPVDWEIAGELLRRAVSL